MTGVRREETGNESDSFVAAQEWHSKFMLMYLLQKCIKGIKHTTIVYEYIVISYP